MYHLLEANDANAAEWLAFRTWFLAQPSHFAVAADDPAALGISAPRWAPLVRAADYLVPGATVASMANTLATAINALTSAGKRVYVTDLAYGSPADATPVMASAMPLLSAPPEVVLELPAEVSYEALDSGGYPLVSFALLYGLGVAAVVAVNQYDAENFGDPFRYIDAQIYGPDGSRFPYLRRRHLTIASESVLSFVFRINDWDSVDDRRVRLSHPVFLDFVLHRAASRYPMVFGAGPGSQFWDSTRIRATSLPADVTALFEHYTNGIGAGTLGKARYYGL